VGDLPAELEVEVMERDHWVKADLERGERSLERMPEEELYCLVQREGRWEFPRTDVKKGEALDEAVKRGLVGVEGEMGGRGMNSWVVTKKPVGVVREGEDRVSYLPLVFRQCPAHQRDILPPGTHTIRRTIPIIIGVVEIVGVAHFSRNTRPLDVAGRGIKLGRCKGHVWGRGRNEARRSMIWDIYFMYDDLIPHRRTGNCPPDLVFDVRCEVLMPHPPAERPAGTQADIHG
jgi:hypothetical protein